MRRHCLCKLLLLILLCAGLDCGVSAKVVMPTLFSDGMVLQRGKPLAVYGQASASEDISLKFMKKVYRTKADDHGNWSIQLPPQKAGGPYEMVINDVVIKDLLIGDVYLCSGQSNMELPVSRVMDKYKEEVLAYTNPMVRYIKVPLTYNFHEPQTDISKASWKDITPENAMTFSAFAYFFAKEMYQRNKVPVGIINSSVGGSPVTAWMSDEALADYPEYLNEKRICQSDEYIKNVKALDAQHQTLWNTTLNKSDVGRDGVAWKQVSMLDYSWAMNDEVPVNGSHWFSKDLEIPDSLSGREAVLRLGCIVDADSTFVNGTFVGTVAYQYPPRIYKVPAGVLKAGKNNVTIRLISYSGPAHFVPEKPYKMIVGGNEFDLSGEWSYHLGCRMPSLQGQTAFQYSPVGLYNGMIAPIEKTSVKGVIWYQGESNTGHPSGYAELLTSMINDWRNKWNDQNLPFVIVELPGFMTNHNKGVEDAWGKLRNEQAKVATTVKGTALAKAADLGEWNDIHPLGKKDIALRAIDAMYKILPEK
jgi:sialate O-acetylesterase